MLHVDIVSHSPPLLASIWNFVKQPSVAALRANYEAMLVINDRRKHMWEASDWRRYNDFRVFIMGIKGNTRLFGDGVVYEGSFDDKPQQFRGQSGSQDDIVPCEDIFTGVIDYYPDNELTRYLLDMRTYRPPPVREFFEDLQSCNFNIETFASLGRTALIYLLAIVDQVYVFRNGHWQFVQKYILSTTRYPVATGGTPITSWLPNQIEAVLMYESDIIARIDSLPHTAAYEEAKSCSVESSAGDILVRIKQTLPVKLAVLAGQREELAKPDYDPTVVHNINPEETLEYDKGKCPMHL
jgi:indoleamine 2,3-dioxygenase